jgi:hypothetical protein
MARKKKKLPVVKTIANGMNSRFAISAKDGFEICILSEHKKVVTEHVDMLKSRVKHAAELIQKANPHKRLDGIVFAGIRTASGKYIPATTQPLPGSKPVLGSAQFQILCSLVEADAQVIYRKKNRYWAVRTQISRDLVTRENLREVQETLDLPSQNPHKKFASLLKAKQTAPVNTGVMAQLKRSAAR